MFNQVKDFDASKPVRVYRNLTKKCWSVQQAGLVVAYCDELTLANCRFIVQPAGRDRVRATRKKNVHAFVTGTIMPEADEWLYHLEPEWAIYNPYYYDTFVDFRTGLPLLEVKFVQLTKNDVEYY